jgi:hypothetical protein
LFLFTAVLLLFIIAGAFLFLNFAFFFISVPLFREEVGGIRVTPSFLSLSPSRRARRRRTRGVAKFLIYKIRALSNRPLKTEEQNMFYVSSRP